jgi:segregation and condensation protein B
MSQDGTNPETRRAIEAVLMAATEPIEPQLLAELLERPAAEIELVCAEMSSAYEAEGRGFVLARVAGGYRFQTHPQMSGYVERFVLDGQHARLSPASLETLAIIAYKQPISRMQVTAIRGVNVDATVKTLLTRGYVEEIGRDDGPGNAVLYGTTKMFLEKVGVDGVHELPPLSEFIPGPEIVEVLERGLRVDLVAEAQAPVGVAAEVAAARADADTESA